MDTDFFREQVSGYLVSINTPFKANGEIDYQGLADFVEFTLAAGVKTILFTPGDSLYVVLDDDEIAELTRFTSGLVRGRAMFIAASGFWWTDKAVNFARYAREKRAHALITPPPDRGMTVQALVSHFKRVSEKIPVFILSGSLASVGIIKAVETLEILLEEAPGVVGLKEDYCPEFARRACQLVSGRWAVFAGGQKQTHMDIHPYGCLGYSESSTLTHWKSGSV